MAAATAAATLVQEIADVVAEIATAGIPPYPGGAGANFQHNLQYIIGLPTLIQIQRITINGGITKIEDLLLVDEEAIINSFTNNTSAMCKTRMRTLKRWAQERSDDQKPLNMVLFTPLVCRARQIELARR